MSVRRKMAAWAALGALAWVVVIAAAYGVALAADWAWRAIQ